MLDGTQAQRYPRVLAALSLVNLKAGRLKSAFDLFRRAQLHVPVDASATDPSLACELALIDLMLCQYGHEHVSSQNQIADLRLLSTLSEYEPATLGFISIMQCLIHLQTGSFELSRYFGKHALAQAQRCRSSYEELHIYIHLGAERLVAGKREEALAYYRKSLGLMQESFRDERNLEFKARVFLGELFWEFGETAASKKDIRHILNHQLPLDAPIEVSMAACKVASEYLFYHEGAPEALKYIGAFGLRVAEGGRHRLVAFSDALRFLALYRAGSFEEARQLGSALTQKGSLTREHATWREWEIFSLVGICNAKLAGEEDAARSYMAKLLEEGRRTSNKRLMSYALMEEAVFEIELEQTAAAHDTLARAFELVESTRYLRPVINKFDEVGDWIRSVWGAKPGGSRVLSEIEAGRGDRIVDRKRGGLNHRQIQVLTELCKQQSDKRIAKTLGITPDGVRYHLKAIYTQLSVSSRSDAIQVAREQGLV